MTIYDTELVAELLADADENTVAPSWSGLNFRGLWELTPAGELVPRPVLYPAGTL